MAWRKKCFAALDSQNLFEDTGHRTRFLELLDCFSGYPFFSKGLCKCIYLSAWDEEHFCIMLETLTDMSLGRDHNTKEMAVKGTDLAESPDDTEAYMYQFSLGLLNGAPLHTTLPEFLSDDKQHTVQRTIQASEIIDEL